MSRYNFNLKSAEYSISDIEVVSRVLGGEKDLYAIIVRRYNERLYRIGRSMINDEEEIEDAIQTAYVNAYENLRKFAFKASFSTWLTRIFINECTATRKKKNNAFVWKKIFTNEFFTKYTMDVQTPAVRMLNSELKEKIEFAIRKLPEKYRIVFVMREIENMSVAETQACLNLSEGNVKIRLNRAKVMLRNSLSAYYDKDDIFHFHLSRCDRMVENVMRRINTL